jgi:bacillithiol synthase
MSIFKKHTLPFSNTGHFNKLIQDYLDKKPFFTQLQAYSPDEKGILLAAQNHTYTIARRNILTTVIKKQYEGYELHGETATNIDRLVSAKTFTITTGHQLSIFGGPLYVFYKLVSAINLARDLTLKNPDYNFVPVYWMATEDHDIEEISSLDLFGKKIKWNTPFKGPAGNAPLTGIEESITELIRIAGESQNAKIISERIRNAYLQSSTLAEAHRKFINSFFGKYGLIIIDGNNIELKKQFTDVTAKDIGEKNSFRLVSETNSVFETQYNVQVNPREINFFYLGSDWRERVIDKNEKYKVINQDIVFSKTELSDELQNHPARFSPNVIMRPLYQSAVLPDVAYIGGPAEVAYWLQLKKVFLHYNISMPAVLLRNCALIADSNTVSKLGKVNISIIDIFHSVDELIRKFLTVDSGDFSLNDFSEEINKKFEELGKSVTAVDPTLQPSVEAEKKKILNSISIIEQKIIRAKKRNSETLVSQIKGLKEKLFPSGKLQEREESFVTFFLRYGEELIPQLLENFKSLPNEFIILEEQN